MMTREEILSIEEYCAEHKVSHKDRLAEIGVPSSNFYRSKQKYRAEDESAPGAGSAGQFIQLSSGRCVSPLMPPARTQGRVSNRARRSDDAGSSPLTVELQTRGGMAMRIHGILTPAQLREILSAGNA